MFVTVRFLRLDKTVSNYREAVSWTDIRFFYQLCYTM
jgi:hypothetical protein